MSKQRKQRPKGATGVLVYVVTADAETGAILRMYQQVPDDLGGIPNLQPVVSADIAVNARLGTPGPRVRIGGPQISPTSSQARRTGGGGVRRGGRRGSGQAPEV